MKHIVSISLGTSTRDKTEEAEILGESFLLERRGTDGNLDKFATLFRELDGKVDALGIGGADLYVVAEDRRYTFRQIKQLVSGAVRTPIVDGSGIKHTLERASIEELQQSREVDFKEEKVLLVSAVDRFGMAQALSKLCPDVIYGDIMFALQEKVPLRRYSQVRKLGKLILPIVTRLPFRWFYPTGEKQEHRSPMFGDVFQERTLIAGDWHYIRRYAPDQMPGKTVLTQTLRKADLALLEQMGVSRAITTTPRFGGETFATNVLEGIVVALLGKRPEEIQPEEFLEILRRLDWKPNVFRLSGTLNSSKDVREIPQ